MRRRTEQRRRVDHRRKYFRRGEKAILEKERLREAKGQFETLSLVERLRIHLPQSLSCIVKVGLRRSFAKSLELDPSEDDPRRVCIRRLIDRDARLPLGVIELPCVVKASRFPERVLSVNGRWNDEEQEQNGRTPAHIRDGSTDVERH